MRDIRDDLRDRANLLDGQINDAQGQFEALVQRFKQEHDSRLKDLKAELQALSTLIGAEERRLDRETAASKTSRRPNIRSQSCRTRSRCSNHRFKAPSNRRHKNRSSGLPIFLSGS